MPTGSESITVGDHAVELSNPEKELFPGISKREYVQYYRRIAPYMLEHIRHRPISLERFPEGIAGEHFFQKEIPDYFPSYFERVTVPGEEGDKPYGTVANEASIVYLANLVTIPHIWMSCVDHLRLPDRVVWDLDPMDLGFDKVKTAAKLLRYLLGEIGLDSYPLLTGSRGIHVVTFVEPVHDARDVFTFAKDAARLIAEKLPQLFTVTFTKSRRGRKIYVDTHRNVFAQTAVAPYAVRALEGAPIALPIDWTDVDSEMLDAQSFTIRSVWERLDADGPAWTGGEMRQDLAPALDRVAELLGKPRSGT